MGGRGRWLVYALLAGAVMCLVERYQPMRLREFKTKDISPELEWSLREWSQSSLSFHPAWLLKRHLLTELEHRYPLKAEVSWNPLKGTLSLIAHPFKPALRVHWQRTEYLVAPSGEAWRTMRWRKGLSIAAPDLPLLKVGNSFPLLDNLAMDSSARLLVPFDWLYGILQSAQRQDLIVQEPELVRRGGEDVLYCQLEDEKKNKRAAFMGLVSNLDESLAVAQELMEVKAAGAMVIDATYGDKVIVKRTPEPHGEPEKREKWHHGSKQ